MLETSERFFKYVEAGDCWEWTGGLTHGHGRFWSGERLVYAHRWCWEYLVGPIPDGLDLDHVCRNRRCVNPDHLEAVSRKVNIGRGRTGSNLTDPTFVRSEHNRSKTHCPKGHPYAGSNLFIRARGSRECRTCMRQRDAERRKEMRTRNVRPDEA